MSKRLLVTTAGVILIGIVTSAWAQFAGESVTLRAPSETDVYAAGRTVELLASVNGDAVLAGQSVVVAGSVTEDVIAAGETVSLRGAVGDDARLAARHLSVQARIDGHLVAAGQRVALDPSAAIGDWAWLAGQEVIVHGEVGGDLRAAGETIRIAGDIGGNADLYGDDVRIEAGAAVVGNVTVHSRVQPVIEEGAQISGQIVHLPTPAEVGDGETWDIPGRLFFGIAVLLALLVFYWLFPRFGQRVAATSTARPLTSLALGVCAVAATPLVVVVLLITGIGLLLALPLLAVYPVLLLLGYLAGIGLLADLVARRADREPSRLTRSLLLTASVLAVALVALIPVLGPLALLLLWLLGTGALIVEAFRAYRGRSPLAAGEG